MPTRIITLTTDFGLKDPYVAEMKAAILSICPTVTIVDVTHEVEKFNVRTGAFLLASATPFFPEGTIHVAVVDPGVGTRRRSILMQTKRGSFVGPDNGLLVLAAEKQGVTVVREIANPQFMLPNVSSTFHGRDVFAPAAAHLANEVMPDVFGPEIRDFVKPEFAKVARKNNKLTGEVLHVDDFGNITTNISAEKLVLLNTRDVVNVELSNFRLKLNVRKTYAEAKSHEPLALIGSSGYLELAVNQGNAAETFNAKTGDKIKISPASTKK